jgi:hypothetical protein
MLICFAIDRKYLRNFSRSSKVNQISKQNAFEIRRKQIYSKQLRSKILFKPQISLIMNKLDNKWKNGKRQRNLFEN